MVENLYIPLIYPLETAQNNYKELKLEVSSYNCIQSPPLGELCGEENSTQRIELGGSKKCRNVKCACYILILRIEFLSGRAQDVNVNFTKL